MVIRFVTQKTMAAPMIYYRFYSDIITGATAK